MTNLTSELIEEEPDDHHRLPKFSPRDVLPSVAIIAAFGLLFLIALAVI